MTVTVGDTFWLRARDGIHYSQDSISCVFHDGGRVKSQWDHWMRNYSLTAVIHAGRLYTLNNRTLYAAKHFDKIGSPTWVHVTVVDKPVCWDARFTTKNDGDSIEVRGEGGECCIM
jgi:hypothetical protein